MNGWHNVSRGEPCPICHKTDWCNLSDDGAVVICHRVESGKLAKSGSGWIHRLGTQTPSAYAEFGKMRCGYDASSSKPLRHDRILPRSTPNSGMTAPKADCGEGPAGAVVATSLLAQSACREATCVLDYARIHRSYDADPVLVEGLATMLGVDDEALKAMDVRYNWMDECWSFPMRDAEGKIVGLRYRELCGSRKWSAKGGKDGLFGKVRSKSEEGRSVELVVLEGASDTAAALSLGLNAVGRSSCQTGAAQLKALIRRERPRIVTIVADNDEPGIRGAELLATNLLSLISNLSSLRILVVPHPYKDLRAWYTSGKLTAKVFNDIASAQRFWG